MNFKSFFIPIIRILIFPISCIYGLVIHIRNYLFNIQLLKSKDFPIPIICIGNLSVGGTGKTPMVEWLISFLKDKYNLTTLSRGYKRKTKGFIVASENSTVDDLGDEPMQFFKKFPEIKVAVGENRAHAIELLLQKKSGAQNESGTDIIILDDGFQHRKVKADINLLLTDFHHLFTDDFFLPSGRLRDSRISYKRAQIILVTKCPENSTWSEKSRIITKINPTGLQKVYFTSISYGLPYHFINRDRVELSSFQHILLVHGIANPQSLKTYIDGFPADITEMRFKDHHDFTDADIQEIIRKFQKLPATGKLILTTEKDAVKICRKIQLTNLPLYILPIQSHFLFDEEADFKQQIESFIQSTNKRQYA